MRRKGKRENQEKVVALAYPDLAQVSVFGLKVEEVERIAKKRIVTIILCIKQEIEKT